MSGFAPLDARLGNYDDCQADLVFQLACAFLGCPDWREAISGWRQIDADTTQFRLAGDPQVWTVKCDHDGAPDGSGTTVLSVLVERADA